MMTTTTMMNDGAVQQILGSLRELGAVGLKAGFEAEAQDGDDILRMRQLAPDFGLTVKIGGPEATTDLCYLLDWGIRSVVAPMVETAFAVQKAVMALSRLRPDAGSPVLLTLNLESVSAFRQRHAILAVEESCHVHKVNVGRTDLAASMGLPVESRAVMEMTREIVRCARAAGKKTGVGGTLLPNTITEMLEECAPDQFETRHVVFDASRVTDPVASVRMALEFECLLIDWLDAPRRRLIDAGRVRQAALGRRLQGNRSARLSPAVAMGANAGK